MIRLTTLRNEVSRSKLSNSNPELASRAKHLKSSSVHLGYASALPCICYALPCTSLQQNQRGLERALWWQFFGGPFAIMWMVGVPSAPGRCRVLYWFFTPSAAAPERLAKQAAEADWKVSAPIPASSAPPACWCSTAAGMCWACCPSPWLSLSTNAPWMSVRQAALRAIAACYLGSMD